MSRKSVKGAVVSEKRTTCEVHREIYDLVAKLPSPDRERIENLLEESYGYVKAMDLKLTQYNSGYDEMWYEKMSMAMREAKLTLRKHRLKIRLVETVKSYIDRGNK